MLDAQATCQDHTEPIELDSRLNGLRDELKELYVAITRARARVFFFDESLDQRDPMYSHLRDAHVVTEMDVNVKSDIGAQSSTAEWSARGRQLISKGLFTQAAHCFKKSGDKLDELKARGHALRVQGQKEGDRDYLFEASVLLLQAAKQCSGNDGDRECLETAAEILQDLESWQYAGEIFRVIRAFPRAVRCFAPAGLMQHLSETILETLQAVPASIDLEDMCRPETKQVLVWILEHLGNYHSELGQVLVDVVLPTLKANLLRSIPLSLHVVESVTQREAWLHSAVKSDEDMLCQVASATTFLKPMTTACSGSAKLPT